MQLFDLAGPLSVASACLASGIVMPLPEDLVILFAGWQMRTGELPILTGAGAAFAGTLGRDALAFGAGRLAARAAAQGTWLGRLVRGRRVMEARARMEAHGDLLLFGARFAVGMRSALYFAGGTTGRPFRRFVGLDVAGLAITTPLLLGLGWSFGPDAATWLADLLAHQRLALGVLLAIGGGVWAVAGARRRARRASAG